MSDIITATAHTNIALIKYWGKENVELNIPTTSSLSMTLDKFYTTTSVEFNSSLAQDTLILNEKEVDATRVHKFLNIFRSEVADFGPVLVISKNHVPTAAGLASSASSFAALTGAVSGLLDLNLLPTQMSRYARRGSGSASRSIFGNFVIWNKGEDDDSSYAESFLDADIEMSMIVAEVSTGAKKVSSTVGMQLAQSSPLYSKWQEDSAKQLENMKKALMSEDIEQVGLIAQDNALAMHELNRTSSQPFDYFTDETRALIEFVQNCYKEGLLAFVTIDAGPNVKIITNHATEQILLKKLKDNFPNLAFDLAHAGSGLVINA
ncbi:MAG: diphosphomevalonate decarboxylase [Streptococcaceae bacterium]|jgi:diphosphomevalonate decarboxylase|nr:diphosphomevalonate decarboxylase [Streptococcaceae bacterium]